MSSMTCCLSVIALLQAANPDGNSTIRAPYADSEIVITTTNRLAGAIHSVTWNELEFIDSADHGRQLQSASNFDAGSKFTGETFNPTEAGSRFDGAGKKSSSQLLHLVAKDNRLQTTNRMAFWLRPGERSGGQLAKNRTVTSDHLVTKRVVIGYADLPNVIQYDVTFTLPITESHKYAQFEAVTGYMPPTFNRFETVDVRTRKTAPLDDGPGEQHLPILFSTESGSHAMGVFSPDQPSPGYKNAGYGRWRFTAQRVVKWNCVFRIRDDRGIRGGDFSFRNFVVVGTRQSVIETMVKLASKFPHRTR